jgi:lipopolysaccharide transport system permease protein
MVCWGADSLGAVSDAAIQPAPMPGPSLSIRPPGKWSSLRLSDIWDYRELVYFLTKRELQVRYKQSIFGVSWAVLQPLVLAFIFALFFGVLAKVKTDGAPYPVFAMAGLVPWLFVAQSVSQAATSLVGDANLLTKIYFPRMVLPLARVLALLVDLAIALVVLLVFTLSYGVTPSSALATLPLFLLLALLTAAGGGILLSALNVQYRDITVVVPLMVQVWLFATPVIYPGSLVSGAWRYAYALNPMVSVIDGFRWALGEGPAPAAGTVAVSAVAAAALVLAALVYFRRTEQFFADVI